MGPRVIVYDATNFIKDVTGHQELLDYELKPFKPATPSPQNNRASQLDALISLIH